MKTITYINLLLVLLLGALVIRQELKFRHQTKLLHSNVESTLSIGKLLEEEGLLGKLTY